MAKQTAVAAQDPMVFLDPHVILADDNTRFGLKPTRIDSLAKSITERGEVLEPVEVELLESPSNGHKYRLTTGFYRHAAVTQLNAQGGGVNLPAIVRNAPTPAERLRRQLAENMERENQSPMDQAIAIKRLLDTGLTKMEVREIFSRPGGRKGNKTQPASNSFINMTLSFLDLTKDMQKKIHEGIIGVATAYELTKIPVEKRAAVLTRAEADRERQFKKEEKTEENFLAAEAKRAAIHKERGELVTGLQKAEEEKNSKTTLLEAKTIQTRSLYDAKIAKGLIPATRKEADKAFRASEKEMASAEEDLVEATKVFETHLVKLTKFDALQADKAKVKTAPAPVVAKTKPVSSGDIKKAAKAEKVVGAAHVALGAKDMREVISELTLAGVHETVQAIAKSIQSCFLGAITPDALYKELVKIVS